MSTPMPVPPQRRFACPECYAPVRAPKHGKDGRCARCRRILFEQARASGARWAQRLMRASS